MAHFLKGNEIDGGSLKLFSLENASA